MNYSTGIYEKDTKRQICILDCIEVKSVISKFLAKVSITQSYTNNSGKSIECIYIFPISYKAQISSFKITVGGTEIKSEFKEKEEAFKKYNNAIENKDSAFLLESFKSDIFQLSIGNILDGEKILIEISYVEEIKIKDNTISWILPTVIAPRYSSNILANNESIELPVTKSNPYTLKVEAVLKDIGNFKEISSPSHKIKISNIDSEIHISLVDRLEYLDRDFILNILTDYQLENSLIVAKTCNESVAYLTIYNDFSKYEEQQSNKNYIFMIDISGSMDGIKLKEAKRALEILIRNLIDGDYFDIVAFESRFYCMSDMLLEYNQQNLNIGDRWIERLTSTGGTEIYLALDYALNHIDLNNGLDTVLFLLTDGQIWNEKEVLNLVKQCDRQISIYTFGIDTAVNYHFIDELARLGNGISDYIYPGESIETKVMSQFSKIHKPFIENLRFKIKNNYELDILPRINNKIYGLEVYNFTIYSKDIDSLDSLSLIGNIKHKSIELKLNLKYTENFELLMLKHIKEKISLLESKIRNGSSEYNDLLKKDIIELSLKYNLMSNFTAIVATYERNDKTNNSIEKYTTPINIPKIWEPQPLYLGADINIPMFVKRKPPQKIVDNNEIFKTDTDIHNIDLENLNEIILTVAKLQNADGSFNSYENTLYYIVGLLLNDNWKIYKSQLYKAGNFIISQNRQPDILETMGLYLLDKNKILKDIDLEIYTNALKDKDKNIFNSFKLGNIDLICEYLFNIKFDSYEDLSKFLLKKIIAV